VTGEVDRRPGIPRGERGATTVADRLSRRSLPTGGLDLQRHWGFGVPGWWPFRGPDDVVLGTEGRTRWREEGYG
jgi:hypothetical protein